MGSLKKLSVLALQSNQLTGAIPTSLGDLGNASEARFEALAAFLVQFLEN